MTEAHIFPLFLSKNVKNVEEKPMGINQDYLTLFSLHKNMIGIKVMLGHFLIHQWSVNLYFG